MTVSRIGLTPRASVKDRSCDAAKVRGMDHQRLRRRDRGQDRVTRLTKTVAIVAGVGALLVSVGAARSNPGRFTSRRRRWPPVGRGIITVTFVLMRAEQHSAPAADLRTTCGHELATGHEPAGGDSHSGAPGGRLRRVVMGTASGTDRSQFQALGTTAVVAVTSSHRLSAATALVAAELAAVDRAYSRFRPDSELMGLCGRAGQHLPVSPAAGRGAGRGTARGRLHRRPGRPDRRRGRLGAGIRPRLRVGDRVAPRTAR